ncbi:hypothetical protein BH09ACT12_BH09ACT12_27860 [soil metagenome]
MRQAFFDDPSGARESSLPVADAGLVALAPATTTVPAAAPHGRRLDLVVAAVVLTAVALMAVVALLADAGLLVAGLVALVVAGRLLLVGSARSTESATREAWALARSLVLSSAVVVLALAVSRQSTEFREEVALLGCSAALIGALGCLLIARRRPTPRVVVVADEDGVADLLEQWGSGRHLDVVGALVHTPGPRSKTRSAAADLGVPLVNGATALPDFVRVHRADAVLVDARIAAVAGEVRRLEWLLGASPVAVLCAGATGHVAPRRLSWTSLDGLTLSVIATPSSRIARLVKAVVDRLVAGFLVLCSLPIIGVLAALVCLDSRGPAFFRQTRIGIDGAPFTLFKLRTMTTDAEDVKQTLLELDEGNGVLFKMRNDPRVTRVGRWLRASSLDELPQLWNVVRGDMSLVGPRPALPEEVAVYSELERRRLSVKPGVTGPWQISGRSSLSRERSMLLDVGYADNWHPAGDARILLRTIDAVLLRRGAF